MLNRSKGISTLSFAMIVSACEYRGPPFDKARFCPEIDRYLSEQEVEDSAIRLLISYLSAAKSGQAAEMGLVLDEGRNKEDLVEYKSVEQFRKINPRCCHYNMDAAREYWEVINNNYDQRFWNSGVFAYWIFISYKKYYQSHDSVYGMILNVDRCGDQLPGEIPQFDEEGILHSY